MDQIYNSRNYYRLLNYVLACILKLSTTVEITIGYLTSADRVLKVVIYNSRNYYRLLNILMTNFIIVSTTVEITIGYLTVPYVEVGIYLQQ